ncbi:MAG: hypothetical protein ACK4S4_05825 [Pyrinomonadaceae bacterium]
MRQNRAPNSSHKPPFWLAASNFYVLSVGFSIGTFFLIWAILHDASEETAVFPAGIIASGTLLSAVGLRLYILRRIRSRLIATRRLEQNLAAISPRAAESARPKLSIEQNARIIREIERRSEAAKLLAKYPEGHREVYLLCREYLAVNENELRSVGPGSPRIAALRHGRRHVEEIHRHHLLQWTELEVTALTNDSRRQRSASKKIDAAERALEIIGAATEYYPAEPALSESAAFLDEYIAGIRVADLTARARRAEQKDRPEDAAKFYRRAREVIDSRPAVSAELRAAAMEIDAGLEKIRESNSTNK